MSRAVSCHITVVKIDTYQTAFEDVAAILTGIECKYMSLCLVFSILPNFYEIISDQVCFWLCSPAMYATLERELELELLYIQGHPLSKGKCPLNRECLRVFNNQQTKKTIYFPLPRNLL